MTAYSTLARHRVCHTHAALDTILSSHTTTKGAIVPVDVIQQRLCHLFALACMCAHKDIGSHSFTHSLSLLNSTFTAYNMHDTLNSSYNIHKCSSVMLLCHSFSFPAPSYNASIYCPPSRVPLYRPTASKSPDQPRPSHHAMTRPLILL